MIINIHKILSQHHFYIMALKLYKNQILLTILSICIFNCKQNETSINDINNEDEKGDETHVNETFSDETEFEKIVSPLNKIQEDSLYFEIQPDDFEEDLFFVNVQKDEYFMKKNLQKETTTSKNHKNLKIKFNDKFKESHKNKINLLSKHNFDDNFFITNTEDDHLKIWNLEKQKSVFDISLYTLITKTIFIDQKILVCGDNAGGIYFLDIRDKKKINKCILHKNKISDLKFYKNKNCIVSCGRKKNILFTDIRFLKSEKVSFSKSNTKYYYNHKLNYDKISCFDITSWGLLITNGTKNSINIWNISYEKIDSKLKFHKKNIDQLKLFNDDKFLLSNDIGNEIVVWNLFNNKPSHYQNGDSTYNLDCLEIINDRFVVFQDTKTYFKIWDIEKEKVYSTKKKNQYKYTISLANKVLIGAINNQLFIYTLEQS